MKIGKVKDSCYFGSDSIEIIEMESLKGAWDISSSHDLYYINKSGVTLKFVRIILNGGIATTESGALYYSRGKIKNSVPVGGITGFAKKLIKSSLSKEKAVKPQYSGAGEIILEPSFSHFILLRLDNESFIADRGIYYCSIGDITVEPVMQSSVSGAALGKEGLFQTKITGTGVVALKTDVPMEEIEIMALNNETLQVDGNFAILRSEDMEYSVEKSSKSILHSYLGGEGLLQTFRGTGEVWLAPTSPVYRKMSSGGIEGINYENGNLSNDDN